MRIMPLVEVAEARGLTLEGLALLRASWISMNGDEIFPMTADEVDWQIGQYNAVAEKYTDMRRSRSRAIQFIEEHAPWVESGEAPRRRQTRTLTLDEDQIEALLSILRGVQ